MLQAERVLDGCANFLFGQEVGESGTPHLQGCVRFNEKQRFTACQKLFGIETGVHWSKMRSNWDTNVKYCLKESKGDWSKIHGNIPEASRYCPSEKAVMEKEYKNVEWRTWQQHVIDLCNEDPDDRKIFWFWEPEGNSGKSYLMKWLAIQYRCVIGGGKRADIFHQVTMAMDKNNNNWPELILFDIPRSSLKYVSYAAMEELKNGLVNAPKYEGGQFKFPKPQCIVFANEPPHYGEMSADRWCVKRLCVRSVNEALNGVSSNLIV